MKTDRSLAAWPARAGLLALTLTLSACANFAGIFSKAHTRDAAELGLAEQPAGATVVAAQWWRDFGDTQLNGLIEQALQNSPSIGLVQARLARAQAGIENAESARRPQLNGSVDATHQLYTKTGLVPPPLAGTIQDTGTAQLSGSWELDFFGKNRAALDAALGATRAAQADAQAARVLLASQVAHGYFQWLRAGEQLAVAQRTLAQREQMHALVGQRVQAGLDSQLELKQSEGSLPQARQQIEVWQEQVALARHALAALTGRTDAQLKLQDATLDALKPVAVATVIPADLLGRRADVAAARWRVEAAGHDVAAARRQFYPNINLVAYAGYSSIGLDRLWQSESQQWGIGPALRLPIFDGGRLRANLRGKTADLDTAIESYNATVLEAVHDVADQVSAVQSVARQQDEQRAAQRSAEQAYAIAEQRYGAGLGNLLQVLAAESEVLAQRRQAVDLATRALDNRVGLLRALGGGFQAEAEAPADEPPARTASAQH